MQRWCNLAAKESGLDCACMNNDDFTVLVSKSGRHYWVNMCTVWLLHSKWLRESSTESASDFAVSLNIPPWNLMWMIQKAAAMGQWWLIASAPHHTSHPSCLVQRFLAKHQIIQVTQLLYGPHLVPCDFCLFPKLKSPLKGKRFQTIDEIQENMMGQLMVIGRIVSGPKVPT